MTMTQIRRPKRSDPRSLHTEWVCPSCGITLTTILPSRDVFHPHGQGVTATTVYLIPKEDMR